MGIIRVSGHTLTAYLKHFTPENIEPRKVLFTTFTDSNNEVIDQGLLLYFKGPHSFTGEDVIELHGHGGPVVMDALLTRVLELGARLAQPGEFSQRAFLNDKIDLIQAEAIADLIDASSREAARGAARSLQGVFSDLVHQLVEQLIQLRIYIEAAIDFPEEEIDFLADGKIAADLTALSTSFEKIIAQSTQGTLLREGMTVVIAGRPNAGKSSLLNRLSGQETAIVTPIAGTTRDILKESINIDGMPLHIVDTAGLRESEDVVEQEGIRRAWSAIEQADRVLLVVDAASSIVSADPALLWPEFYERLSSQQNITVVFNKIDKANDFAIPEGFPLASCLISAATGEGLGDLKLHLKNCMGYQGTGEGSFVARRRHLDILNKAWERVRNALHQLTVSKAGELVAEDLRHAQQLLGEITGEFSTDDLLGKIFSSFCIGK